MSYWIYKLCLGTCFMLTFSWHHWHGRNILLVIFNLKCEIIHIFIIIVSKFIGVLEWNQRFLLVFNISWSLCCFLSNKIFQCRLQEWRNLYNLPILKYTGTKNTNFCKVFCSVHNIYFKVSDEEYLWYYCINNYWILHAWTYEYMCHFYSTENLTFWVPDLDNSKHRTH